MALLKKGAIAKTLPALIGAAAVLPALLTLCLLVWQQEKLERIVADVMTTRNMEGLLHGYHNLCKSLPRSGQSVVKDLLRQKRIGASGYVAILQGRGERRGSYVLSEGGRRDGENLWDAKDAEGKHFVRNIIARGLACTGGRSMRSDPFYWKNPGEVLARRKAVFVTYYAPWDWVICISAYEDERDVLLARIHQAFFGLLAFVLGAGCS